MATHLKRIEVDEISLLSKHVRPAVSGALVAIAKREDPPAAPFDMEAIRKCQEAIRKSALGTLDRMAKSRQAGSGMTFAAAFCEVLSEHPELYQMAQR